MIQRARGFPALAMGVVLVAVLGACGSSDSTPPPASNSGLYNYTVTSADTVTQMPAGRSVVIALAGPSSFSDCSDLSGTPSHGGHGVAVTPGSANLVFGHSWSPYYAESVYLDMDNSNSLTNGDLVWGSNPVGMWFACWKTATKAKTDTVPWDVVAGSVGSATWSGGSQAFSAPVEGAPESAPPVDITIGTLPDGVESYSEL